MSSEVERLLTRALLGDDEARRSAAKRATAGTPAAAEIARIERIWAELELPPPAPCPPGFARRLAARARGERTLLPGFALSPARSGLAAALLIALGVAGGLGIGAYALPQDAESESASLEEWVDYGELDELLFAAESDLDLESESAAEVAP